MGAMVRKKKESALRNAFMQFPQVLEYSKPKSISQKKGSSGKNKRRERLPDPELFVERPDINDVPESNFTPPAVKKQLETQNQLSRFLYK